ncbi:MAG TPA: acetyl-CoA acetyltransferase [Nitriliruptorales bacterium]
MMQSHRDVYLVGAVDTALGEVPDQTELGMFARAAQEALAEGGLSFADVDGLFTAYMGNMASATVGEYLGINEQVRFVGSSDLGGCAFEQYVHDAMLAVSQGHCEVALVGWASRQRTRRLRSLGGPPRDTYTLDAQFQAPYGLPLPIGHYAMMAARHMHQYGTTSEQLAEVAAAASAWAQLNPAAWRYGQPIEVADVLASPLLAEPLHKLDCCLVTDGGGAVVVTAADRARDAAKPAVRVLGAAHAQGHVHLPQMRDLTVSPGARSGPEAFARAGITPDDVDVLQPYDSFTITVLMALEDLGFCAKGEGGPFLQHGTLRPGGKLPSMTSGGGLAHNHPGALGIQLLIEAVRQLRGECGDRQVPGAEVAVAHGVGGMMSTTATVVLARD